MNILDDFHNIYMLAVSDSSIKKYGEAKCDRSVKASDWIFRLGACVVATFQLVLLVAGYKMGQRFSHE